MKHFFKGYNKILSELTVNNVPYAQQVGRHTLDELADDLGNEGDITTTALCVDAMCHRDIFANVFAREDGIVAGVEEAEWFLEKLREKNFFSLGAHNDSVFQNIRWKFFVKDGNVVRRNMRILELSGDVGFILALERTLLNLLQRMSGIATQTRNLVLAARKISPNIQISATRKTLWGLLDKKAVVVGGGWSHRPGLYDAVLVKDTHRAIFRGDFSAIFEKIENAPRFGRFVEIEVENLSQARRCAQALQKRRFKVPFLLMLDNMKPLSIRETISAVKKIDSTIIFEASGGINEKNIVAYAASGADILSLGALTHSARGMDMSLEIK